MPQTQSLRGDALCNLQAKPEREERNAEMAGTGPPPRHGVRDRVGAGPKFDGQHRGELTPKIINGDCAQPPLGRSTL